MLLITVTLIWTMFEVLGKEASDVNRIMFLKKVHRAAGILYFAIYFFVAYFCLKYIVLSRTELTPRGNFHTIAAVVILVLFLLKVSYVRVYRNFYSRVQYIGLIMAVLTFVLVTTSGGYYLFVTGFGSDTTFDRIYEFRMKGKAGASEEKPSGGSKDGEAAMRGEALFKANCSFCHDPLSNKTIVGPGLKGVLKNPRLPVSKKPAIRANVRNQLRNPYRNMPNFSRLSDSEVDDIITYLSTL